MGQDTVNVDLRESLCNGQAIGPIGKVQLPEVRITTLHGIMFDFDPMILIPGNSIFPPADTPKNFYVGIQPILDRHPLARFAEVRMSGTGLHLIVWMRPPVELTTAAAQARWGAIVKAIQRTLPIDPDMPGITAVTRPISSVNGKNGAGVTMLHAGESVDPQVVEQYMATLAAAPFRAIAVPLLGEQRVSPCPVCRGAGTRLDVLDWVGMCYGSCGKITLEHLFDAIYVTRPMKVNEAAKKPANNETQDTVGSNAAAFEPTEVEQQLQG